MAPVISKVIPDRGRNNQETIIEIYGSGFDTALVYLGEVLLSDIQNINSGYITAKVQSDYVPDIYDLKVVNGDSSEHTLSKAYRVLVPIPTTPFTNQQYLTILNRILSYISVPWDVREGSFFRDLVSAPSLELEKLYQNLDTIFLWQFIQTTDGFYLDLRAEEFGFTRIPSVKATGTLQFTGVNDTVIPRGSKFSTLVQVNSGLSPIYFETIEEIIISGGTASVDAIAVVGGLAGNALANTITQSYSFIDGLFTINNSGAFTEGQEQESDSAFRERFLQQIKNPISGGNKSDYVSWAKEVTGIGSAVCLPLWNGNGTVKVVIVDTNGDPADGTLITNVQNYISPNPGLGEGKAPIGADVTVVAATPTNITITGTVAVKDGYNPTTVRDNVELRIINFIKALAIGDDVLYNAIANVIYNTDGVGDYSALLINTGTSNITIPIDGKAIPFSITIS